MRTLTKSAPTFAVGGHLPRAGDPSLTKRVFSRRLGQRVRIRSSIRTLDSRTNTRTRRTSHTGWQIHRHLAGLGAALYASRGPVVRVKEDDAWIGLMLAIETVAERTCRRTCVRGWTGSCGSRRTRRDSPESTDPWPPLSFSSPTAAVTVPADGRYRVDARRLPFTPSWFWEVIDTSRNAIVENSLALSRTVYQSPTEAAAGRKYLGGGLRAALEQRAA